MSNNILHFKQENAIFGLFNDITLELCELTIGKNNVRITDISEDCNSLEKIIQYYKDTGHILIDAKNSENTMYGDANVNYYARAWHDWCHIQLNAPFTYEGEMQVLELQRKQIIDYIGKKAPSNILAYCLRLIDIEVKEQLIYFNHFGIFPPNQYEFTLEQLYGSSNVK